MSQSDLSLIAKVVFNDDHESFGILIDKYQSDIHGLFFKLTNGDVDIINDLSQEVFIKIYKHLKGFKATAKFSTWIYKISINVFYDYQKSLSRNYQNENEVSVNNIESIDNKIDINKALQILSDKERVAILLHYEKGFTHKEIQKIMKLPLGTVKSLILRGKLKLKKFYNYEDEK
jgi:RNA polymerase sigma-70 factor (ECF subfamily)